jgi:uncharacterized protein
MKRFIYAFRMGRRFRRELKRYTKDRNLQIETILELKPELLKSIGVRVLAVDFDGVLASHGEHQPDSKIVEWLASCVAALGKENVYVLSNKPIAKRIDFFNELGIELIRNVRKKPYPDGLQRILEKTQVSPNALLLIDDRLLTGILAAEIVGTQAKLVTKPYMQVVKRPVVELSFMLLRALERGFFSRD